MSLGACRLNKRILALALALCAGVNLIGCGTAQPSRGNPGSFRVVASQGVTTSVTFGGLITINGEFDVLAGLPPVGAGSSPALMAISPSRKIVAAFDASTNSVYGVDTTSEKDIGNVRLQGPTESIVVPTSAPIGFAAVPSATVNGFSFIGAVDVMNYASQALNTIAVPSAQWVVSNSDGTQLLVFSADSDNITVIAPAVAVPPVDTSCLNIAVNQPLNPVCAIVQDARLSRPVNAIISGSTAYILNCGLECGGTQQASVAIFDMGSMTITGSFQVNGATDALINGTTMYVVGTGTPSGPLCSTLTNSINPPTAATYCGTLDIVDLNTMTDPYLNNPAMEIAIPDGYHWRMDLTQDGQLFVGSRHCTNIGNVNNPSGEVRGCLAIYNTVTNSLVIPPDNGDVDGLQGFVTRYIEYVAEGGNLRVYDTIHDILYINSQFLPTGSVGIVGYVGDVKAIDFF